MAFTGKAKKDFQRKYMPPYMRDYRARNKNRVISSKPQKPVNQAKTVEGLNLSITERNDERDNNPLIRVSAV